MKILHTSDWHIGHSLYGHRRIEEHIQFLNWLLQQLEKEQVDVLLICGDIFDTQAPGNKALKIYYEFLAQVTRSCCQHIVITGGNHDSPSLLNAPKEILNSLNIHVIGKTSKDISKEVLTLQNKDKNRQLVVCAVPYLRDKDVRQAGSGESLEEKKIKLSQGIGGHYQQVCNLARFKRSELAGPAELAVMGHLFAAGGKSSEGVRDLYIGGLGQVQADIFEDDIDYLALGHLHLPQKINNQDTRRYSGSPLAMSFGEAEQKKQILSIEFLPEKSRIKTIEVPCFQHLQAIRGKLPEILQNMEQTAQEKPAAWLDIVHSGTQIIADLNKQIRDLAENLGLEVLRIKDEQRLNAYMQGSFAGQSLKDLSIHQVFKHCLQKNSVPVEQIPELEQCFAEIMQGMEKTA